MPSGPRSAGNGAPFHDVALRPITNQPIVNNGTSPSARTVSVRAISGVPVTANTGADEPPQPEPTDVIEPIVICASAATRPAAKSTRDASVPELPPPVAEQPPCVCTPITSPVFSNRTGEPELPPVVSVS